LEPGFAEQNSVRISKVPEVEAEDVEQTSRYSKSGR